MLVALYCITLLNLPFVLIYVIVFCGCLPIIDLKLALFITKFSDVL